MRSDNITQLLLQYVPGRGNYSIDFQNSANPHVIEIPDSGSTSDVIALSNYNNTFYGNNIFSEAIKLNNYLGSTSPFTGDMFVLAPANGTSYTIQATNPAFPGPQSKVPELSKLNLYFVSDVTCTFKKFPLAPT